jgi:hypothetical protein
VSWRLLPKKVRVQLADHRHGSVLTTCHVSQLMLMDTSHVCFCPQDSSQYEQTVSSGDLFTLKVPSLQDVLGRFVFLRS